MKRKKNSKKIPARYLGGNEIQKSEGKEFAIVSPDEIFLFYDTLIRCVWKNREKRSVVRITGSQKHVCLFGAISIDGNKHLFRQYDEFNSQTFLEFLKNIHCEFPRCYLFMDTA